jgi:hypothetical protein
VTFVVNEGLVFASKIEFAAKANSQGPKAGFYA